MKTTLTTKGRVVIPRGIRVKWGLKHGHEFVVLCSSAGEILFASGVASRTMLA